MTAASDSQERSESPTAPCGPGDNYILTGPRLRPCQGREYPWDEVYLFHGWGSRPTLGYVETVAVVEDKHGRVKLLPPETITFTDKAP